MRSNLPSLTAVAVAFARGLASLPSASHETLGDRTAAFLLPQPARAAYGVTYRVAARFPGLGDAVLGARTPIVQHLYGRTRAIDDALRRAVRSGIRQCVLLGAGLDGRAWRMEELAVVDLFELDHPSTHRLKRRRSKAVSTKARSVRSVAVDFGRDRLDEVLKESGFDPSVATVWIWEGVTPYLTIPQITSAIRSLSELSAAGSELIATYALPSLAGLPRGSRPFIRAAFRVLGEPLQGAIERDAMARLLRSAGFAVLRDEGTERWQDSYGSSSWLPLHERVVVARRDASSEACDGDMDGDYDAFAGVR